MVRATHGERAAAIRHYSGAAGERYYAYQSRDVELMAEHVAGKFSPFVRETDVVVDFGCGGGTLLRTLRCSRRIGVEINPAARHVAEKSGLACFGSLSEIPDATVDVAISHHSLEHVASPLRALIELQSKLKPRGVLLVVVPIDDWRVQSRYDRGDPNHHLYTWTPLLLGNLLDEAGFDVSTLATTIGVNGWFGMFPRLQAKLPKSVARMLLRIWASIRKTREIRAMVRTPAREAEQE